MSKIQQSSINALCPTQLTIGFLEVDLKKKELIAMSPEDQAAFLEAHPMPTVLGPGNKLFITDHHHLGRAALEAKIEQGWFEVEDDLSTLSVSKFWPEMDKQSWVHPLDEHGVRHHYESIPSSLDQLLDDVYRSLAGFVRDAGGYEKTRTAFAEFIWADFFRRNIAVEDVMSDFSGAVRQGDQLARSSLAKGIPGFKDREPAR